MVVWEFIKEKLNSSHRVILIYVVDSEGSSPGRQGFKMAVANDGESTGTIGGGIMEHKLVEKAKNMLEQNLDQVSVMRQFHDKKQASLQSGMICSGSQCNVFVPLTKEVDLTCIQRILSNEKSHLILTPSGLSLSDRSFKGFEYTSEESWIYSEKISSKPIIHIVGGGHISLALSELMIFLGFYVKIYDDRPNVKTMVDNGFAYEKIIIPTYESIGDFITNAENDFIVIMTVGYRTDKVVLQKLWGNKCKYLGLLGSDFKVNTLLTELKNEGKDHKKLFNLFTPIGLPIFSKTTQEIAVSIAAEIIKEKNKELPSGRNQS